MPKLTKTTIAQIEPPAKGVKNTWDSELKGFGVRTSSGGTQSYALLYRSSDGRSRWYTIGRCTDMTPDEARKEAMRLRVDVSKGGDPAAEKSAVRKAKTASELFDAFLRDCETRARPLRPNTVASHRSNIENHLRPVLGGRSANSITSDDVKKLQTSIAAGKTAKRKPGRGGVSTGGEGAAARAIAVLGAAFEYGRREKILSVNPVTDIEKLPPKERDRFLTSEEIVKLGAAMREALADGESPVGIAALRFLLLSGFRRMEALTLQPNLIDRAGQSARIFTKTGKQVRALGKSALVALDETPSNDDWCFPSERSETHFVAIPKVLGNLLDRAEIMEASAHDLRRTYATIGVELGFSEIIIGALLGHKMPGVTGRYARTPDKALLLAADAISERITGLLGPKTVAKVIPLRSA
ncbi:tyrosine-type recombinase/integrase [Rhizobium ruizarguesonis]